MSSKNSEQSKVFKVDFEVENPVGRGLLKVFKKPLEMLLDFNSLNKIHQGGASKEGDEEFSQKLLDYMNITLQYDERCLERIPKTGNIVFVANHPFGGIEGVIMGALLRKVRPDVKIMANKMLERIPELRDIFIYVNPFETKSAARENLKSMKETIRHLENGGALGVFPAGAVSHRTWKNKEIADPEWSDHITRIIRKTDSAVVPIFFSGANNSLFQFAGMVHPLLRTILLPRQFSNKQNKTITVSIGKIIPKSKINGFTDEKELTRYLRQRTYLLETFADTGTCDATLKVASNEKKLSYQPIIDPVPVELLTEDIAKLESGQLLLKSNEFDVYYAAYRQIPNVIREIGRLREFSFREIDEGTGKSIDLDEYDKNYMHLFVWQREKQEIVGAYRLGRTDNIIKKIGMEGLYTTTLFKMKRSLLDQISPALEMGRSFIRPEYQRSFAPLLLLWKGIGHYVVKYPKYKILFGPVSISNDYEESSRNLLVTFLKLNNYLPDLARQVKPKTPFKLSKAASWISKSKDSDTVISIDDISEAISNVEADAKGVPILIKQYLKLGGKLLGFNLDPDFADALDGLILVDLSQTDPKILVRYMGEDGIKSFQEYHQNKEKSELNR